MARTLLQRAIRKINIYNGTWYIVCSPTEVLELLANGAKLTGFGWNRTLEQIKEEQAAGRSRGFRYGLLLSEELQKLAREAMAATGKEIPVKGVRPMTRRGPGKYGATRPQK